MRKIRGLLLLDQILLWTGLFPFKFHLKYLLVWNSWLIRGSFIKDLFENENSVQWTDWDSNRVNVLNSTK